MYLTRNKNGDLWLWKDKPMKFEEIGEWMHFLSATWMYKIPEALDIYPHVQWENKEPFLINDKE